jgi:Ala-tRNA(Pro) deacylase
MGLLQFKMIENLLKKSSTEYEIIEHAAVYTSEEAARIRGVDMKSGVKSLILKSDSENYLMTLVPGDKRVDLKKLAKILGAKRVSLAQPSEVLKITGCTIGSVHPFGNVHHLRTWMDRRILTNERVEFNAGLHTVSIRMKSHDLMNIVKPHVDDFSMTSATTESD